MKFAAGVFLVVASALVSVQAECPNKCSGHGICTNYAQQFSTASATVPMIMKPATDETVSKYGYDISKMKKDSCTCFTRIEGNIEVYAFQGPDCSQRTCPYDSHWAGAVIEPNSHDLQTECSGRGTCDRNTGNCKCVAGYSGKACSRFDCDASTHCSGHGRCKTLNEIATAAATGTGLTMTYGTAWDADRIVGCDCDEGYKGSMCELKECPSGEDPLGGAGALMGRECSGRGKCNYQLGECECHQDYTGNKCDQMNKNYV